MSKFEIISKYENAGLHLPKRATANAAGYDFEVAEDIYIPPISSHMDMLRCMTKPKVTLEEMAIYAKKHNLKPTLVPTGIKCQLEPHQYLELSVRSSLPLKHWLILANGVGIIDADYYNNPDNEGHIYFQLINLSPLGIYLKKGDKIGQGIIKSYGLVEGDQYGEGEKRKGGFGSTGETISVNAPHIIGDITTPIEPHYVTTTNVEKDTPYTIYLNQDPYQIPGDFGSAYQMSFDDIMPEKN